MTKTVCQHSRELPEETMDFLRGIAADYAKVKTAVYERYSGIRNVNRLTPVYTVQKEMRVCGLRQQLKLPVVYYELAVAEAVTNIKAMWERVKERIRETIRDNDNLSPDERMYIRTILKMDSKFAAILNRRPYEMPRNSKDASLNVGRLNNLVCRLARRYLIRPEARRASQFKVAPTGYNYQEGGIYLVSRVARQRVYLPLKDTQVSSRQIRVNIFENSVQIHIPVDVDVPENEGYGNIIYGYIGYHDAITLSNGHIYGKELEQLVSPETERLCEKNAERYKAYAAYAKSAAAGNHAKAKRIARHNLGKKKYDAQKERIRARTQNYINAELNRMIEAEKPKRIVVTKPVPKKRMKSYAKAANRRNARNFSGYIRRRLAEKCRVRGIELIMVSPMDTRNVCSQCGAAGACNGDVFHCPACGYSATVARNSARNIEKKASATELTTG